jgi:hypothetical protein
MASPWLALGLHFSCGRAIEEQLWALFVDESTPILFWWATELRRFCWHR